MKIYIAGPYTPITNDIHDAIRIANKNVERAISIAIEIINRGHVVYIPQLSHFIHIQLKEHEVKTKEFWYNFDLEWLKVCDALFYMESSEGADKELEWAEKNGLHIFKRIGDVPVNGSYVWDTE